MGSGRVREGSAGMLDPAEPPPTAPAVGTGELSRWPFTLHPSGGRTLAKVFEGSLDRAGL